MTIVERFEELKPLFEWKRNHCKKIRNRQKQQSKLKKERANIARSLQQTLREGFLWETILDLQAEDFPESYREFGLVRLVAAVARMVL